MTDLIYMMNTLVDKDGKILVDGIMDKVKPVTKEELATYGPIAFDVDDYRNDLGAKKLINDGDKVRGFNFMKSVDKKSG